MSDVHLDLLVAELRKVANGPPVTFPPPLPTARQLPIRVDAEVTCRALRPANAKVGGWIDGIQQQRILGWVSHRPIIGAFTCALALDHRGDIVSHLERLRIVCSEADAGWVRELADEGWIDTVADGDEKAIQDAAGALLGQHRARLERELAAAVVEDVDGFVVVDGPLTGHVPDPRIAGVVKTHQVAYLTPQRHLHDLREGQITDPAFEILDPASQEPTGRFSAYLRLHEHRRAGVWQGLVRLEARSEPALEAVATTCMAVRQWPGSQDARWDVHLEPIAWVERMARRFAPRW